MTAQVTYYVYDPKSGRDVPRHLPLDFDGSAHSTQEAAATALYEALQKLAISVGQDASEVVLWSPKENSFCPGQWGVCWEAGPYDWAIGLSMQINGPWGFTEPYYGFDLHFTD